MSLGHRVRNNNKKLLCVFFFFTMLYSAQKMDEFESVPREKVTTEGSMIYSLDSENTECLTIEQFNGREVDIVVSLVGKESRHIYVNIGKKFSGVLFRRADRFDQISEWWKKFNAAKDKKVLYLICLRYIDFVGSTLPNCIEWEQRVGKLSAFLNPFQTSIIPYGGDGIESEELGSENCVIRCAERDLTIDFIEKDSRGINRVIQNFPL
jgi:hypothetical protein